MDFSKFFFASFGGFFGKGGAGLLPLAFAPSAVDFAIRIVRDHIVIIFIIINGRQIRRRFGLGAPLEFEIAVELGVESVSFSFRLAGFAGGCGGLESGLGALPPLELVLLVLR